MARTPLSVTLQTDNITWLKARTRAVGARSLSDLLDRIVTEARRLSPAGDMRSVMGTIDLDPDDPMLMGADEVVRAMVDSSLARPTVVKEAKAASTAKRRRRV